MSKSCVTKSDFCCALAVTFDDGLEKYCAKNHLPGLFWGLPVKATKLDLSPFESNEPFFSLNLRQTFNFVGQ